MICKIFVYSTLAEAAIINITFNSWHLFVPNFNPSPETHVKINESIKKSFTLSFESWTTDRKVVNTGVNTGPENQLDIGSSLKVNSPKI